MTEQDQAARRIDANAATLATLFARDIESSAYRFTVKVKTLATNDEPGSWLHTWFREMLEDAAKAPGDGQVSSDGDNSGRPGDWRGWAELFYDTLQRVGAVGPLLDAFAEAQDEDAAMARHEQEETIRQEAYEAGVAAGKIAAPDEGRRFCLPSLVQVDLDRLNSMMAVVHQEFPAMTGPDSRASAVRDMVALVSAKAEVMRLGQILDDPA